MPRGQPRTERIDSLSPKALAAPERILNEREAPSSQDQNPQSPARSQADLELHTLLHEMTERLTAIERQISDYIHGASWQTAELEEAVIQKGGKRPNFWADVEVRKRAIGWHGQMTVREALERMAAETARAPSKSALARFWKTLDGLRGLESRHVRLP